MLVAAAEYRKGLKSELERELAPFLDERGRPEDAYRGAIKRIEIRFQRKERRAERDYVDWVLLAVSSMLRDRIASAVGGGSEPADEPRPRAWTTDSASRARRAVWPASRRPAPSSPRTSTSTRGWWWSGRSWAGRAGGLTRAGQATPRTINSVKSTCARDRAADRSTSRTYRTPPPTRPRAARRWCGDRVEAGDPCGRRAPTGRGRGGSRCRRPGCSSRDRRTAPSGRR